MKSYFEIHYNLNSMTKIDYYYDSWYMLEDVDRGHKIMRTTCHRVAHNIVLHIVLNNTGMYETGECTMGYMVSCHQTVVMSLI